MSPAVTLKLAPVVLQARVAFVVMAMLAEQVNVVADPFLYRVIVAVFAPPPPAVLTKAAQLNCVNVQVNGTTIRLLLLKDIEVFAVTAPVIAFWAPETRLTGTAVFKLRYQLERCSTCCRGTSSTCRPGRTSVAS